MIGKGGGKYLLIIVIFIMECLLILLSWVNCRLVKVMWVSLKWLFLS